MFRYICKRLLEIIPVLIAVTIVIFILLSFTPGEPALISLGPDATQEQIDLFNEQNGLNDPLVIQYLRYMKNALTGDFGMSYNLHVSVSSLITSRLPNTLILVAGFMVLTVVMSIPLGIAMAIKQNSLFDNTMRVFTLFFNAMPQFWLALVMILLFSVELGWLPSNGLDSFKAGIMPTICLALSALTLLSRSQRSSMLETIHQDYIRTAKSKGLSYGKIITKHALKNSLLPVLTLYGSSVGTVLGGSIVIETVFGISGIGKMTRDAMLAKDVPTVMASVIITAFGIALINLLTDIAYAIVDPRIRIMYAKSDKKSKEAKAELKNLKKNSAKTKEAAHADPTFTADGADEAKSIFDDLDSDKKIELKSRSMLKDVWIRLKKNKSAVIGIVIFIVIVVACFSSPLFFSFEEDIVGIDAINRLDTPSKDHLFGLDELGRNMFARVLWGGRVSIFAGLCSLLVGFILGGLLGTIAAYYGGRVDNIIMRIIDVFMAIPSILLMITLATIMIPSTKTLIFAIGLSLIPRQARIVRAQVLQVKNMEYIEAIKIQGASAFKIIVAHILPNAISPIITTVVLDIGFAITMISTLSYLGMGVQPPTPEWGYMLSTSQEFMRDAWHLTTIPGLVLMLTVVSLTLVGDGLRDALDPRMKR